MTTDAGTRQPEPWTPDDSTFGARLALIRQRMGWGNVKVAAEQCGLPVESWRNWERDGMEPRRLTTIALTIASRTGCDYLWLVHGRERGAVVPTTRYASNARVLATVGKTPGPGKSRTLDSHTTRPVHQTRPAHSAARRAQTPISV